MSDVVPFAFEPRDGESAILLKGAPPTKWQVFGWAHDWLPGALVYMARDGLRVMPVYEVRVAADGLTLILQLKEPIESFLYTLGWLRRSDAVSSNPGPAPLDEAEVRRLLSLCEAADDQDTGSLDAFREAATPGAIAPLCRLWLCG